MSKEGLRSFAKSMVNKSKGRNDKLQKALLKNKNLKKGETKYSGMKGFVKKIEARRVKVKKKKSFGKSRIKGKKVKMSQFRSKQKENNPFDFGSNGPDKGGPFDF